ncbi:MAG: FtsX-like permease family protein [Acidimicrobiales bacterium]|nr:FtsX-like permease family protein [Acidimicrobiales bacterium]
MLRHTLRSITSNKARFLLTTLVVVLGVTFVVASFALADSLRDTFGQLSADVNEGIDVQIQAIDEFDVAGQTGNNLPVPASVLDDVRQLDGVNNAAGGIFFFSTFPIDGQGRSPGGQDLSTAVNFSGVQSLDKLVVLAGEAPVGPDQFALSPAAFEEFDFEIGNRYAIESTATGRYEMELVGEIRFGLEDDASLGGILVTFDNETAQLVSGYEDSYQLIGVEGEPGVDPEQLVADIQAILPDGIEAITGQQAEEDFSESFEVFIGPFQTVLLVFAFIVLFVSTFIINNTFNIILGQRVRELGMLRALGATGRQVRGSVVGEALIVGIAATALGIGLGLLGALGLKAILEAFVGDFPSAGVPLRLRTIIWAVGLGVGFTVLASLLPAWKASRIPPIAALREEISIGSRSSRARTIFGVVLAIVGIAAAVGGLTGSGGVQATLSLLGFGAAVIFLAVAILAPLFAGPVVSFLAAPLPKLFGTPGAIARENARRSPRRTAATAIALTIGLALVTLVTVVAASLKQSVNDTLESAVAGDFVIFADGGNGIPPALADELRTLDELDAVVRERFETVRFNGEITDLEGSTMELIEEVVRIDVVEGSTAAGDPARRVAISTEYAEEAQLGVGDFVPIEFAEGGMADLEVVAIYADDTWYGDRFLDIAVLDEFGSNRADGDFLLSLAEGVTVEVARPAIEAALGDSPLAGLRTREEAIGEFQGFIDIILTMATIFLGFALLIAIIGIVNTLTLSVIERTREIGLLRAVGMTRRQSRKMIRWEAVAIALFGAVLGIILGMIFGFAIVEAVPDDFIGTLVVPWVRIVFFLVAAVLLGMVAAFLPARRASKMNVLEAIAHE